MILHIVSDAYDIERLTGTLWSAGLDLRATSTAIIPVGETVHFNTGVYIRGMPRNNVALVLPRSGKACHSGIKPANSPGLIDSDYEGEIIVCLVNEGKKPYNIEAGERIAQLVRMPIQPWYTVSIAYSYPSFGNTERGTGGFGSTGDK